MAPAEMLCCMPNFWGGWPLRQLTLATRLTNILRYHSTALVGLLLALVLYSSGEVITAVLRRFPFGERHSSL